MSRSVLVVDFDLDALGELASALRTRGLDVSVATDPERAVERARRLRPDVLVLTEQVATESDLIARFAADRGLRRLPGFVLVAAYSERFPEPFTPPADHTAEAKRLAAMAPLNSLPPGEPPNPLGEDWSAPDALVADHSRSAPSVDLTANPISSSVHYGSSSSGPSSAPPVSSSAHSASGPSSAPPVSSPVSAPQSGVSSAPPSGPSAAFVPLLLGDVDLIARRVMALPKQRARDVKAESGDFRGDLDQVSVMDLLQLLGMNQRTGALILTTRSGIGEVRLQSGEIVDAVYRQLEGEKALYRLFGEREGSFTFTSGYASALRRVQVPTHTLLMEGMRRVDEVRVARDALPSSDALLLLCPAGERAPEIERVVSDALASPRTVDELLDELPQGDLEVLLALRSMLSQGLVRLIPKGAVQAVLAEPEQQSVLAAMVARLARPGFAGNPRILFAATPARLAGFGHATRRIADAVPPQEPTPAAPVPHLLASLRIGEQELDVVALPTLEAYAPLWSLSLPGSAAVVRLDEHDCPALEEACAVTEVPLLEAYALLGDVDEADPVQVAALLRASVEQVAGQGP
ncbi:MAG: DUF4388 domain-containing protein [Polyangiaceae bacterium]|nr:DUF4388 domain-containing protein [Polyangiaceae bacterium]MCW5790080.1 DUF4388 domain-containing protein [Polyangiaceae bacterium]